MIWCYLRRTTTFPITIASNPVVYDAVVKNSAPACFVYDEGTGVLTVNADANLLLIYRVSIVLSVTFVTQARVWVEHNGVEVDGSQVRTMIANVGQQSAGGTIVLPVSKGDRIQVWSQVTVGVELNTQAQQTVLIAISLEPDK